MTMRQQITDEEKNEIESLFSRKCAIQELMSAASNCDALYQRLIRDYSDVRSKFEKWFRDFEQKYAITGKPNAQWVVDFNKNEVILAEESGGQQQ